MNLREFTDAKTLRLHYRETLARLHSARRPKPKETRRRVWWEPRVTPIFTKREIELFAILRRAPNGAPALDTMPPKIQAAVCDFYGVSLADMVSDRKSHSIVRPRQAAMYLCRVLTGLSSPAIARRFGGRDHTTILYAVARFERLMRDDPALAAEVDELKAALQG